MRHVTLASDDLAICYWQNLVVVVWTGNTLPHHVADIRFAVERARKASDGPVCLLQLVIPEAAIPDSGARTALSNMLRSFEGTVSHSAVVHFGSGFRACVVRSVVTAISALRRQGFPHQVFGSIQDSITWLVSNVKALQPSPTYRMAQQFYDEAVAGGSRAERLPQTRAV